mgnify:CR=1 FL=1
MPGGRRGSAPRGDLGSVTAEVAVAVPTVVVVLAACLGGIAASAVQLRAQDAAADAARVLARGDSAAMAQQHVSGAVGGAGLRVDRTGDLVCATVTAHPRLLGVPIALAARSCALDGGR